MKTLNLAATANAANAAKPSTLEKLFPSWIALGALALAVGSTTGCILVHDRGYHNGDRDERDHDRVIIHDDDHGGDRDSGRGRGPIDHDRR